MAMPECHQADERQQKATPFLMVLSIARGRREQDDLGGFASSSLGSGWKEQKCRRHQHRVIWKGSCGHKALQTREHVGYSQGCRSAPNREDTLTFLVAFKFCLK